MPLRRPQTLRPFVDAPAKALEAHHVDAVCGPMIAAFIAQKVARHPNRIWKPADCPLCRANVPLERLNLA